MKQIVAIIADQRVVVGPAERGGPAVAAGESAYPGQRGDRQLAFG